MNQWMEGTTLFSDKLLFPGYVWDSNFSTPVLSKIQRTVLWTFHPKPTGFKSSLSVKYVLKLQAEFREPGQQT